MLFYSLPFLSYSTRYTLTKEAPATEPPNTSGQIYSRVEQIFQTYRSHLEIPVARRVIASSSKTQGPKNIRPQRRKLSCHGDLVPGICAPLTHSNYENKIKESWVKYI